jgi:geranylgeranyl pyrophosphate synthase
VIVLEIKDLMCLLPPIQEDLHRVVTTVRQFLLSGEGLLAEAVNYFIEAQGGYARPSLVLAAAYAAQLSNKLEPANESVITAAAAIELLNVSTLYQDDVIDHDRLRRGIPSANAKWGDGPAILAGDHLVFSCIGLSLQLGCTTARDVLDTAFALVRGEMKELEDRNNVARSEQAYLDAISGKQASLIACACKLGAGLSGLETSGVRALEEYGYELGMAGQIIDDVLDITSDQEFLGKPVGSDLLAGIYTLPVIYALRDSKELRELLSAGVDNTNVKDARRLVVYSGGIERAREIARKHVGHANAALRNVRLNPNVVQVLAAFAEEMLTGACWRE